jgi:ligand-binding sensor protein
VESVEDTQENDKEYLECFKNINDLDEKQMLSSAMASYFLLYR